MYRTIAVREIDLPEPKPAKTPKVRRSFDEWLDLVLFSRPMRLAETALFNPLTNRICEAFCCWVERSKMVAWLSRKIGP